MGSSLLFVLIPAIYLIFMLALGIIAIADRRHIVARWACFGYGAAAVSILADPFRDPFDSVWSMWWSTTAHMVAMLALTQAVLSRHGRNVSPIAVALLVMAAIGILPGIRDFMSGWQRFVLSQTVLTAIIVTALPHIWALRNKSAIERIILVVSVGAALCYAGRVAIVMAQPVGDTPQELLGLYQRVTTIFHVISAVLALAFGIVLMMAIGYDMLLRRMQEGQTDPLTMLDNRRGLKQRIEDDVSGRFPVGAAMVIDLDHFKSINDRFGHEAGDEVLRSVARALRKLFRNDGYMCRAGGEEFIVLLGRQHAEAASTLALAARKAIAGIAFDGAMVGQKITASVGFSLRMQGDTVEKLIQRADSAVYFAKRDGRDRVCAASQENGLDLLRAVA